MAAPVMHILLGLLACFMLKNSENINDIEQEEFVEKFIVGTVFPDIRYLGVIKREKTHNQLATWNSIKQLVQQKQYFKAGMDFHALVDRMREKYLEEKGIYENILPFKFRSQLMKFVEDRFLYEKIDNWFTIAQLFDKNILDEELTFNIPKKDLLKWRGIIRRYCKNKPMLKKLMPLLPCKQNVGKLLFLAYQYYTAPLQRNKKYRKVILQFYDELPRLLEEAY